MAEPTEPAGKRRSKPEPKDPPALPADMAFAGRRHRNGGKGVQDSTRKNEAHARRLIVAEFRLRGVNSQTEIARVLKVSQPTISNDFKVVDGWWREQAVQDITEAKGQDLARIDRLLRSWFPLAVGNETAKIAPDPRATHIVIALIDRRTKLMGTEQPLQIDASPALRRCAAALGLDPDEVVADAEQYLRQVRTRGLKLGEALPDF